MGSGYIVQRGGGKDYSTFKARVDGSLTEVTAEMLDGATKILDSAFYYCSALTSVTISNGATSIGNNAFYYCSALTSVTIPSSVTSIGDYAFYLCTSLTSVTIQNGVRRIGNSSFSNCTSLASITIPRSVTSIVRLTFSGCTSLTSATVEATTPPTLDDGIFGGTHVDLVIYVPAGSVEAYKSANIWSNYASRIQAIP